MKTVASILFLFLLAFASNANESVLVIEGKYQNKNIYVANSYSSSGVGFCAYEVRVNGKVTSDEINSSAFEINLDHFNLQPGDEVIVQIKHEQGCSPKVLNPGSLQPKPSFEVVDMQITDEGMLEWSTKGEQGNLPYRIEQKKWNKWVKVGEVDGVGTPGKNEYKFKCPLTSGENKFRIAQKNLNGEAKFSKAVNLRTDRATPEMDYNKRKAVIEFSSPTAFEIYDAYGQIRKRGFNKTVDLSNLAKGDYYVNYDNTSEKIRKTK